MDLPVIMQRLSPHDLLKIKHNLTSISDVRYLTLQETLFGTEFRTTFHGTPPADEFIKRWIIKHQNPTWEALVNLIRAIGVPSAAQRIEAIIPTIIRPASEQAALKKD